MANSNIHTKPTKAAFRELALGPYEGCVERRPDGSIVLTSADPLRPYARRYTEPLLRWAAQEPDRVFLAWRGQDGGWQRLTYGQAAQRILPLGQALLDRGLGPERPLMILSENSMEHALLALAAAHVGIPFAPVSPAYSLLSPSAERVRHAAGLLTPGLVFASDAARYARAIQAAVPQDTELVFAQGAMPGRPATSFDALMRTSPTAQVQAAHQAVDADTIVKFLFTSGSTKMPKAVINTHGMMTSNMQMFVQYYPFVLEEPPILVDWMPWHHTAAGNNNFGVVLYHGGTMYIDHGKPTPEGMAETLRNLREVPSTIHYTVPKGLEMLAHEMKRDMQLRDTFFSRMRLIFPCGASLPGPLKQAIDDMAAASCGARIPMTMGLGMTETAPFAVSAHLPDWQAGVIGLPAPGVEVKLAACAGKLEVRYRGPSITPGYWRQPELTAEAFDEEGYFRSGDAACFLDEDAPEKGLRFDGRIAEDFKLASGTWVNVGALRMALIAAGAPYIQDVVVTGHDRDELGALVFLTPMAAALSPGLPAQAPMPQIAQDPAVRAWAQALLDGMARQAAGSSQRIARAVLLSEPASMELGEMTDKGSINQRNVLKTRAALVEHLYRELPAADVLLAGRAPQRQTA